MPEQEKTEMVEQAEAEQVEVQPIVDEVLPEESDDFDKERAMATIKKLREQEKKAIKLEKELNVFREQEEQRKLGEMSEIDRLKLEKQEADRKLYQLTQEKLRHDIAKKVNLPEGLADRIKGETPEEIESDALSLLESLPKPGAPKTSATNPGAVASGPSWKEDRIDPFDPSFAKGHGGGVYISK